MRGLLFPLIAALASVPAIAHAQMPGVRVTVAPPRARVEVRSAPPSPRHQWIAGHWAWRGGAYAWMPGYWAPPPSAGYRWVPARWDNQGGQWVYYEGHWEQAQPAPPSYVYEPEAPPPNEVVVMQPPPADVAEARPAMPFAGAVWIPGYWHWNGRHHVWVSGRWSAPRPGYVWQPHHWQRGPRGYYWVQGGWHR
jgi:hypothetical protein